RIADQRPEQARRADDVVQAGQGGWNPAWGPFGERLEVGGTDGRGRRPGRHRIEPGGQVEPAEDADSGTLRQATSRQALAHGAGVEVDQVDLLVDLQEAREVEVEAVPDTQNAKA